MNLNTSEYKAVLTVALIMATRLLGIFLILPVFSVYAEKYPGSDLAMAGLAFGIYALAQSILQLPFGWASDRIGRKPVLVAGILLFTAGSVYCGLAGTINELIIARIIQGTGAVSSVALASLGDVTRPGVRAQSFTIVGVSIGVAFLMAIVIGPYLAARIGFSSLFYILAGLGALSLLITVFFFPAIKTENEAAPAANRAGLMRIALMPALRTLFVSSLVVSLLVNLFVFVFPLSWKALGVSDAGLWKVYLITLIPTALCVFPYIKWAEKRGGLTTAAKAAWACIALAFLVYPAGAGYSLVLYGAGMAYFAGHTIMQSLLPAFLTQAVGQEKRGSAAGIYNLLSFFGSALGGMMSGYLYQLNPALPLIAGFIIIILWGLFGLPTPPGDGRGV
ncbi:MAG: MFS transporter [Thermodesulfobacteriota bacterium]